MRTKFILRDDGLLRIEICGTGNVGTFIAELLPVSGKLDCVGKLVVKTLDGICIEELLAVDGGRVAA